jgi:S1-C subfamily serine protease
MQPGSYFLGGALLACLLAVGSAAQEPPGREATREAVDRARTKVVILKQTRGAATGFLAYPGLVVTAGHAVADVSLLTAWVNGVPYRAEVVARHPDYDLAMVRLRAPELLLKPAALASTSLTLPAGEPLVILAGPAQGRNATGDPTTRVPIPAAFDQLSRIGAPNPRPSAMLSMRASVEHGDSGSPVIRVRDGTVVGVLSSRELPDEAGVSRRAYAVPVEALLPWLETAAREAAARAKEEGFYLEGIAGR